MNPKPDHQPPKNSSEEPKQTILTIDPGTLVLIVSALILIPLILTGLISQ